MIKRGRRRETLKANIVLAGAVLAGIAAVTGNISVISTFVGKLVAVVGSGRGTQAALLLSFRVTHRVEGLGTVDTWTDGKLSEDGSNIIHAVIAGRQGEEFVFYEMVVRHVAGALEGDHLQSIDSSGAARSQYRFFYEHSAVRHFALAPALVLGEHGPAAREITIHLAPIAGHETSGGDLAARLLFKTGRGEIGTLPLLSTEAGVRRAKDGQMELSLFEFDTPQRFETFKILPSGAVVGRIIY